MPPSNRADRRAANRHQRRRHRSSTPIGWSAEVSLGDTTAGVVAQHTMDPWPVQDAAVVLGVTASAVAAHGEHTGRMPPAQGYPPAPEVPTLTPIRWSVFEGGILDGAHVAEISPPGQPAIRVVLRGDRDWWAPLLLLLARGLLTGELAPTREVETGVWTTRLRTRGDA